MTDSERGEGPQYSVIELGRLSPEALRGLCEEFINREGTDYGAVELSPEEKLERLMALLESGEASVVFDHELESASILMTRDLPQVP